MKRQIKLYILLAVLNLLIVTPALADGLYFGAKTGRIVVNDSAVKTHPTNVGFVLGYEQGLVLGDLGFEAEMTTTTGKGELDSGRDFEADTKALYVAFRTAGPIYFKARGGFLQIDSNDWDTKTGSSIGVGLGLGLGLIQIELEVTKTALDPDIAFASVGVQF